LWIAGTRACRRCYDCDMRTRNILIACIAVASALPVFTHAQAAYDELRAQVHTLLSPYLQCAEETY
jgi:hypothetical protein